MRDARRAEVLFVEAGHAAGGEVGVPVSSSDSASNGAKKSVAFSEPSACTAQPHDRLAEVRRRGVARRRRRGRAAVAGAEQERPRAVGGQPGARLPDAGAVPARRRSTQRALTCARGRDAEHPALPGREVAVGPETRVDDAVHQQQAGALQLGRRREGHARLVLRGAAEFHREARPSRCPWPCRSRPCTSAPAPSCPTRRSCASDRRCSSLGSITGVAVTPMFGVRSPQPMSRGLPGRPQVQRRRPAQRAGRRVQSVDLVVLGRHQQRAVVRAAAARRPALPRICDHSWPNVPPLTSCGVSEGFRDTTRRAGHRPRS